MHAVHEALTAWESFYVIAGSAAAALTGLQFVVMTLISDIHRQGSSNEIDAFGTPTVVHFGAVLLLSAIMSAPWPSLLAVALALGTCGAAGVIYGCIVIRRARMQTGYQTVMEDWIWHAALPLVAYTALVVGAITTPRATLAATFIVAVAAMLLLFIGIHNAWDTVTYITLERIRADEATRPE